MSLNIWTKQSGYSLGSFPEENTLDISLPVENDDGVSYTVISGKLPGGLRISGNHIVGNPYIVSLNTVYSFCIRALHGNDISDRSFYITITGFNQPVFVTPEGNLPVGPGKQLYVLDSTFVSYQIETFDLNTAVGQTLTYFIASEDGELPKGLTLSSSGLISGFIEPNIKITPKDGDGTYDDSYFDAVAFDFAVLPTDGYDSYFYDDVFFDYNLASAPPTTLNANYQFRVTVTDGISYRQRVFKIFVVGTDQFRADNTSFNGVADDFSSDATYLRSPVWINNPELGIYRANNYLTIPIALYDNLDVIFRLEPTNEEVYAVSYRVETTDNVTGVEFTGNVTAYSTTVSNISNTSQLTVGQSIRGLGIPSGTIIADKTLSTITLSIPASSSHNGTKLICGGDRLTINNVKGTPVKGQYLTFDNYLEGATGTVYEITDVQYIALDNHYRLTLYTPLELSIPDGTAFYIGSLSELPPGLKFDVGTGDVYGQLPYQTAVTKDYTFTLTATRLGDNIREYLDASKTFNISIIGDVNSVITWNTPSNLGTIPANYICTLSVNATTTVPDAVMVYELVSGRLPPGLSLSLDGEITGTTSQYWNPITKKAGLTSFDNGSLTFDDNTTTIDRVYVATIKARDQFNFSAITRDFTISVVTPNSVAYSNIVTRPYLKSDQRSYWKSFINDSTIFPPASIYRNNDSNFGIRSDLTMLVYAGIQTQQANAYVGAMGLNVKRKRFQFNGVKKAVAVDPETNVPIYEVVYVQMLDPMEPNGKHLPIKIASRLGEESDRITIDNSINFFQQDSEDLNADAPEARRDIPMITIDSTGYEVSNPNPDEYFPNSITNWQARIADINYQGTANKVSSERNYLPLWMRTIPTGSKEQLGYTLCVPLCYCKPGTADTILLNIKFSGFDFKNIDYTVDRFIIDSVSGYLGDKYLVFKNDRITV